MREAPIILPVFTTSVPLDFPSEGTFAFNKKTNKQLEVTVRINEHQYFNMNFLNHDGYIKKLIWRKWDTTYLEERMKQEDEVTAKVEADQALVKKKSAEWKAIMEGMSFNAFLLFHNKMNELMKTKKATLVKYGFLASEMLDNHKRYWASSYYWHNKEYDEQEYMRYRKQTEIIVTIFYEGILRGTQYGNHPRTKYALKIHSIIEELMNKDWSKVNETLK